MWRHFASGMMVLAACAAFWSGATFAQETSPPEPFVLTLKAHRSALPEPFLLTLKAHRPTLPEPFTLTLKARRPAMPEPFTLTLKAHRSALPEPFTLTLKTRRPGPPEPFTLTLKAHRLAMPEPFTLTLKARRPASNFGIVSVKLPAVASNGPRGDLILSFTGTATFPVTAIFRPARSPCVEPAPPAALNCSTVTHVFNTGTSGAALAMPGAVWCAGLAPGSWTFIYEVMLRDATGVQSAPVAASFVCNATGDAGRQRANDIEPGRYSYSGGSGSADVSIQGPTIAIRLKWLPYLGEYEIKANRVAPGQYAGSFIVVRHAKIDPKFWPKGPFDVTAEYLPGTKGVRLRTTNGTEFFPGGVLELKKEP
jgi:hypothetical protein